MTAPLVYRLTFSLIPPGDGDHVLVPVELGYDPADPYAVTLTFNRPPAKAAVWIIGRDLLADGMTAEEGDGDVQVRPLADDPNWVELEFRSPSGHARFWAAAWQLANFTEQSYALVPAGTEHAVVERELDMVLADWCTSDGAW